MEFRKLTPSEAQQAAFISCQAFDFAVSQEDFDKYLEEGSTRHENMRGAVDENGIVHAGMILYPFRVNFDGHEVGMGGIGGVSTLPEYRRSGSIRGIFGPVMEEMRDREMLFSFLYPFSHPFYRKFGYELGSVRVRVKAPTDQLSVYAQPGYGVQYRPGMDITPFLEVDRVYAARHNMMICRTPEKWKSVLEQDPMITKIRSYILYNAQDKPVAWFQFVVEDHVMVIRNMAWVDREGMWAMLGFWGRFAGNYNTVSFLSSPELAAECIWPEPHSLVTTLERQGMTRVVDAQKVLKLMKKPFVPGEVTVRVEDGFCPWNNNTYRIAWGAGESDVRVVQDTSADLTVSIQALAQLTTGLYPFATVASRMDVQTDGDRGILSLLFPQKQVLCQDFF